jgi:sugar (pentulose or hexulose) kinase/phosphoglycerate dehydrogenase-like enzyme/ribulose-5-phosphate 4-epimerase/fuculose-1-phosphate aldolase/putative sterol carrier protein
MSDPYLMSIDIGGSMGKCLLLNNHTAEVKVSCCEWTHFEATEHGSLAFDLDTEHIWKEIGKMSREVMAEAGITADDVVGVSVTSMRHTTVIMDAEGNAIFATPNLDARALAESVEIADDHGEEFYNISGHWPSPIMSAARLLWVQDKMPEVLAKADAVMAMSDWISYQLTGEKTAEAVQASETMLFDLKKRNWSKDILKALGLPEKLFPKVVNAGDKIGTLTEAAAEHLGLKVGTPVAAAGADTQCGLLGMGITETGNLGIVAGSTTPVMLVTDEPYLDKEHRTWAGLHLIPGQFVCESNAGSMGSALELFSDMLYADSHSPITAMSLDAEKVAPETCAVLSTAGAQIFNGSAISIPIDSITLSTMDLQADVSARGKLARGILEGMAFGVKANLKQINEVSSKEPNKVFVGGGMTRSKLWTQMIADVLGVSTTVTAVPHASGMGAAICAAVGSGLYKNVKSASEALVKVLREHDVDSPANDIYNEVYESWDTVREQRMDSDAMATGFIMQTMNAEPTKNVAAGGKSFRPKIYVSADLGDEAIELLKELGDVTYKNYLEEGEILSGDDLADALQGYQVFVGELDVVDADVLAKCPDLRFIIVCRGNPVNIDIPACTAARIPVANTPGRNADAVADLTLTFMLMLARRIPEAAAFLHEPGGEAGDMGRMTQAYTTLRGDELYQKTIGMVGSGAVGRKVIERLLPFQAKVLVYDPYLDDDQILLLGAEKVSLDELYQRSDIVSLHAAVTSETSEMINAEAFGKMKDGVLFVNTARAALVDNDALLAALQSGKIAGAGLDVFAEEPPGSDDPILTFPNVIATPHIGGNTHQIGIHQGVIIVNELGALLNGKKPRFALNPETLDGFSWTGERKVDMSALQERKAAPGPGMRDLDVKKNEEAKASNEGEKKSGGVLSGIKKIFGRPSAQASVAPTAGTVAALSAAGGQAALYTQVIEKFLANLSADPATADFAQGKNVVFRYMLKELDLVYYMSFVDGVATAGLGEPPSDPDIKLKMACQVFTDIVTNKLGVTKAAMTGKLSYSGDTSKALAIQKLNMEPAYQKAISEVGDPGDLSTIGAAPAAVPAGTGSGQAAQYTKIIEKFLGHLAADPATADFANGKNVVFRYVLKELDLVYYMSFVDGVAKAGLGEPPSDPDIKLKMACQVFTDIVTNKLGVTKAAMTGKLSYSGDTSKALAIQKLNMEPAYQKAISEVGDPGDLSQISAAPAPAAAAPAGAQPAAIASGAAPVLIHKVGDVRDDILEINNELYKKDLITATGGNVSARVDGNPNEVWITPSGIFKGDLTAEMMVKIDLNGNPIGDLPYSASSERHVHCAIYRDRADVESVIHSHAPQATLLGITYTPFLPISTEAAYIGQLPIVPFIMPGTTALSAEVAKAIGEKGIACIMQNHGLVVCGSSVRRAADMTEVVEQSAEKLLVCRQMGVEPAVLPEEAVKSLAEMGRMLA